MSRKSLSLYKLTVLYLLNQASFPLTRSQISDFMLEREYLGFFTLQQVLNELIQAGLVSARKHGNRTHLRITREGKDALSFFRGRIGQGIRDDVDNFLRTQGMELRNESTVYGSYQKTANGEFMAELKATDGEEEILSIRIQMPTEKLASTVCANWQKNSTDIYRYLTSALF